MCSSKMFVHHRSSASGPDVSMKSKGYQIELIAARRKGSLEWWPKSTNRKKNVQHPVKYERCFLRMELFTRYDPQSYS